ncbi:MAG: response regulator [Pyrinomonadaceae bacterium]
MTRILIVDDLEQERIKYNRLLADQSFDVETAKGPEDAMIKFRSFRPDVAVIDYRCLNSQANDRSGIRVALRSDPLIPKIMISALADRDEVMQSVYTSGEGFPLAVRFLPKSEIDTNPSRLFDALGEAVSIRDVWLRRQRESVSPELHKHYRAAWILVIIQSVMLIIAAAAFALLGVYLVFVLHVSFWEGLATIAAVAGGEALIWLLIKKGEPVFRMAENQHNELVERARFDQLLEACENIESSQERDQARRELISHTSKGWLGNITTSLSPFVLSGENARNAA